MTVLYLFRDHYGTQCSDGGERLQVNIQSMAGDYTLAEVRDGIDYVTLCEFLMPYAELRSFLQLFDLYCW